MTVPQSTSTPQDQPTPTAPWPGSPGYDNTKASWYSKTYRDMTDAEVDEARAYDQSLGSTSMDSEWRSRHGIPEDFSTPAVTA
jgi:hypothetical protein